jgi:DNA-binding XRE family transcriptional regulator
MSNTINVEAVIRSALVDALGPPAPTPASPPLAANRPSDDSQPSKAPDTIRIASAIGNTDQLRAARVLLGWDRATLAQRAGVSILTIKRIETGAGNPQESTLSKVADALQDAGIAPVEDGKGGFGVLRRRQ